MFDEINMRFEIGEKKSIKIMEMDHSRSILALIKFSESYLKQFNYKSDKINIGFNTDELYKKLSELYGKIKHTVSPLSLKVEQQNDTPSAITTMKLGTINFKNELFLLDLNSAGLMIPQTAFDVSVTMERNTVYDLCHKIKVMKNAHTKIKLIGDQISFVLKNDISSIKQTYDCQRNDDVNTIKLLFDSVLLLCLLSGCAKLSDEIKIYLKHDFPMCIRNDIKDVGTMTLFLSPYANQ